MNVNHVVSHTLLMFPSIPLTECHQYGLIITRRVLADPTRPFEMSTAMAACLDARRRSRRRRSATARRGRGSVARGGGGARAAARSRRRRPGVARDHRRHDADRQRPGRGEAADGLGAPPPAYTITTVTPGTSGGVAAIVQRHLAGAGLARGQQLQARRRRQAAAGARARGAVHAGAAEGGARRGRCRSPCISTAIRAAPRPRCRARRGGRWRRQGFAVIGFTDMLNRELSAGITDEQEAIIAQVAPVLAEILDDRARAGLLGRDARREDRVPALHRRAGRARRAAGRRAGRRSRPRRPTRRACTWASARGPTTARHPAVRAGDPGRRAGRGRRAARRGAASTRPTTCS